MSADDRCPYAATLEGWLSRNMSRVWPSVRPPSREQLLALTPAPTDRPMLEVRHVGNTHR